MEKEAEKSAQQAVYTTQPPHDVFGVTVRVRSQLSDI